MSKFVETEYGSTKEILKFPDHYVALAVMVDNTGVQADDNGKKIVPKGTIVGGVGGSVLADTSLPVADKKAPVAAALLTGDLAAGTAIMWRAKATGVAGNGISVESVDPSGNTQALAVTLSSQKITVSLATDGSGDITSTAKQIAAKVNETNDVKDLVVATALFPDSTEPVEELTETNLVGGAAVGTFGAEGVLLNDIDVTYGAKEGAMIIHGFVAIDKLPYGDDNDTVAAAAGAVLPMIKFIK